MIDHVGYVAHGLDLALLKPQALLTQIGHGLHTVAPEEDGAAGALRHLTRFAQALLLADSLPGSRVARAAPSGGSNSTVPEDQSSTNWPRFPNPICCLSVQA